MIKCHLVEKEKVFQILEFMKGIDYDLTNRGKPPNVVGLTQGHSSLIAAWKLSPTLCQFWPWTEWI